MSDRIAAQVARHFLAKVLQDTGEESFYGGPSYMMNVTKDRFVHFTYESRAQEILDSGALLANPPYKKFGIEGVQAVSAIWGRLTSGVQFSHLKGKEDLVAIVFSTTNEPDIGYPEEVIWKHDVSFSGRPRIVSFSEGKRILKSTPERVPDGTVVNYYRA